ncbi:hypothetical protein AAVH_22155 [Aphelenchoides avenae]|nr:hypothetical protein AAVH_34118 [Aphelenchus avenae]KAH7703776.1 hypothetical protein AAVH_29046 [Aphelenchus avenae]KAH7710563.1 hypothetical protein AAVH_22155 [Aphelenchus avenae]
MNRFLNSGPLGEKLSADEKKAALAFFEANKGLKKPEFKAKFEKELVPTLSADAQALLSKEAIEKKKDEMKAKIADLSEPAKAVCGKFRAIRENEGITAEEESKQLDALIDSAEFKAVKDELKSKGFPMPTE